MENLFIKGLVKMMLAFLCSMLSCCFYAIILSHYDNFSNILSTLVWTLILYFLPSFFILLGVNEIIDTFIWAKKIRLFFSNIKNGGYLCVILILFYVIPFSRETVLNDAFSAIIFLIIFLVSIFIYIYVLNMYKK
jgi:hypothetical protein